jgi:hypothetical protein
MATRAWLAAALAALLGAAACESVTGVDDLRIVSAGGGGSAGAGGSAGGAACAIDSPDACGQCVVQSCCAQALACNDDPVCLACLAGGAAGAAGVACNPANLAYLAYVGCVTVASCHADCGY